MEAGASRYLRAIVSTAAGPGCGSRQSCDQVASASRSRLGAGDPIEEVRLWLLGLIGCNDLRTRRMDLR